MKYKSCAYFILMIVVCSCNNINKKNSFVHIEFVDILNGNCILSLSSDEVECLDWRVSSFKIRRDSLPEVSNYPGIGVNPYYRAIVYSNNEKLFEARICSVNSSFTLDGNSLLLDLNTRNVLEDSWLVFILDDYTLDSLNKSWNYEFEALDASEKYWICNNTEIILGINYRSSDRNTFWQLFESRFGHPYSRPKH